MLSFEPICRFSTRLLQIAVASALLLHCAASVSAEDEVTSRGLRHTTLDRELVGKAVARANAILKDSGIRFAPSWLMTSNERANAETVPLFLVEPPKDEDSTPAAVPEGCRCVFVNPRLLRSWITFNSKGTGRMRLDRGYFLTFVLLHEAGHIKEGTPAVAFKSGEMHQLNTAPSKQKFSERKADEFAAVLLRRPAQDGPANSQSIEANFVCIELTKLGWNMQAFRTLDEFASFATGKPSVYFDDGYTHPNMALRILRTNDLIQSSEATRSLLKAFEDARDLGVNPKPLYEQTK
ncbi:MAG: hypothetical protein KIT63_02520 [Rhodoferax sp.]|nr:hypothetical protein [Rhodoferax sp.]